MIKRLLFLSPLLLFTGAALDINSNSAPASSSGAPGETDCTTSGCHDTYQVNSGPGTMNILLANSATEYKPGETYTITVHVSQAGLTRFGFQLVALDEQNNNVGTLVPIDYYSNQVTNGYTTFASRRYMTYTFESTQAQIAGQNSWTFKWKAPDSDAGKITFYAATLAADNNGNDGGDYCYTKSASLASSVKPSPINTILSVFPNPGKDQLNLSYGIETASEVKIELVNALGQKMQEVELGMQNAGNYSLPFSLIKDYPQGAYYLRLIQGEKVTVKKIMLEQ